MILKEGVIDNWALAITNIAVSSKKIDKFIEQLTALIELFKEKPKFVELLSIRRKDFNDTRIKIIDETFNEIDFDIAIINTMKILVERDVFRFARTIFKHARKKLVSLHDEVYGVIWSTTKISVDQIKKIENNLSTQLKKKIKLVNKIDASLIGGIQVIVDHKIYDASLRGKLDLLKEAALKQ